MKSYNFSLLLIVLLSLSTIGNAQQLTWPVAGKSAGENIICKPQSYVGNELSYGELFIGGKEGDVIISPADGIIQSIGIDYMESLSYSWGKSLSPGETFDQKTKSFDFGKGTNRKYYSGTITILMADGRKVHISGILGNRVFNTGQKISAGDTLGVIGYSYKAIPERSIMLSISNRDNKSVDPMTPFGLKTTFVEAKALSRDKMMSAEKIREDLDVLKEAICEIYPSLEEKIPEKEFRAFVDSVKMSLTGEIDPAYDFRIVLRKILNKVPDSHIYMYPDPVKTSPRESWLPEAYLVYCDDTARVLMTPKEYMPLNGKVVTSIDGVPVSEYAKKADMFISGYDGKVESALQEQKVMLGGYGALVNPGAKKGSAQELTFSDGTKATVPYCNNPNIIVFNDNVNRIRQWMMANIYKGDNNVFETRKLNDSTYYLGLKTFEMLTQQVEAVRDFLDTCKAANLIVDVRNNGGGHNEVLMQLLSYFAESPMNRQKGGYNRVNKKGQFATLKYSLNYSPDADVFPEYEEGENGYYLRDSLQTCAVVMPDPKVHYSGKVYVLTNSYSKSAAMLFPAILVRNRRGVCVGRETGSTYHSMTALKFADIRLPNSLQTIRIPLVQLVFDTTVCDRLPKGRGLLPDYPVPLTYNEIFGGQDGNTDVILEYALSLISNNKYLTPEDPFEELDKEQSKNSLAKPLLIASAGVLAVILAALALRKKKAVKS